MMVEFERPKIDYPTKQQIAEFYKSHRMKKRLSNDEIIKIKVDFVRSIEPNRRFESKSEIKELLEEYRYTINNLEEIERSLINSMIAVGNIPDELIDKKKVEKKEIHTCDYKCPSCNEQMFDIYTFKRTSYGRNIISYKKTKTKESVVYDLKQITSPNEYQVICLNRECPRYAKLLDKAILK